MNNSTYDNTKIIIKKREDNCLIAIVEYYKNNHLVDKKRTANISFIAKILKTAAKEIKTAEYIETNLKANYQSNGIIVVENYDSIKNEIEFKEFNNKVTKKIKSEKTIKKETKTNNKDVLKGVKNLRVTPNKKLFKKIVLKTKKLFPIVALSTIVMIQVNSIIKTLPQFDILTKSKTSTEFNKDSNKEKITVGETQIDINETNNNIEVKVTAKSKEKQSNQEIINNQINQNSNISLASTIAEPITASNINESSIKEETENNLLIDATNLEVTNNQQVQNTVIAEPIEQQDNTSFISDSQNEIIENQNTTPNIDTKEEVKIEPIQEVAQDKTSTDVTKETIINEQNQTIIAFEPSLELTEIDKEEQATISNQEVLDTEFKEQAATFSASSINENIVNNNIELEEKETSSIQELPQEETYTSLVPTFEATPYPDITEEEYRALVAMVQAEAGGTTKEEHYTDALAVASTPLNRLEDKEWRETCGDTLMEQIQTDEQFKGTETATYRMVYNDISKASPEVIQAVNDALAGTRNSPYLSFRAKENKASGRVQFVPGGNNYFGLSKNPVIEETNLDNNSLGTR